VHALPRFHVLFFKKNQDILDIGFELHDILGP
jgi:hypothetical protein